MTENSKTVQLSWAGRVRTGNRRIFDYQKDSEVVCKFKEVMTRENIYKELEKTKWPLSGLVGMVLRPGALVDFTLKSKEAALKFAKTLSNLESVSNISAHADTVVEVRIDFIPPGFPTEPISEYLINNHGEILTTPIRITDRFNIQTGTRVFKLERKSLDNNPIPSYLYFGQYKFRVRYQGQNTTCGYCAEQDHIERNCPKKANMKTLAKSSKLQRRQAPQTEDQQQEPPTKEEVAKSFERDQSQEKKKEKETSKRPFSDSSSSPLNQPQKRKTTITEDEIRSLFDLEISTDSSTEFEEIRPYASPCCYEFIQKCTGHYFACACEKQYYKCKCGWKTIGQEKGVYKCEQCKDIVANCVGCGSFQVKKKGKLFICENCQCQLTKELYKSLTF